MIFMVIFQISALSDKNASEEVKRLAEELERLNERHAEIIKQEEEKRKQLTENYQVFLFS